MRGHVLVWHNQTPEWFFREGYRDDGEYVDRETMLARMESYIRQVLEFTQEQYPGVIYAWDVVNEAVENTPGIFETESGFNIRTHHAGSQENLWYRVIGPITWKKPLPTRESTPPLKSSSFTTTTTPFNRPRPKRSCGLRNHLKDQGLIDGIGMQGYMDLYYPGIEEGQHNLRDALERFSQLGLEIHITELSIDTPDASPGSFQRQAERYEAVFRLLTEMDTASGGPANITSVTVFGLMDHYLFYPSDMTTTRLFDGLLQPKPAFYGVLGAVQGE